MKTYSEIVEILAQREGIKVRPYKSFSEVPIGVPLGEGRFKWNLPPYLSSLDALQPILAGLTEEEWEKLDEIIFQDLVTHHDLSDSRHILTMKPSQLARCICRAIGKWEEGE